MVTSRRQFEDLVNIERPSIFLCYRSEAQHKRAQMVAFLRFVGFDPRGKRCLDIGPGHGEGLDVLHEKGAAECAFVERDPWFFQHNALKRFAHGWRCNHYWQLSLLPHHHFDFIWNRGAISSESRYLKWTGTVGFRLWLWQIERLAAPNALIVLSPHHGTTAAMDRALSACGYCQLPFIPTHNVDVYPATWVVTMHAGDNRSAR